MKSSHAVIRIKYSRSEGHTAQNLHEFNIAMDNCGNSFALDVILKR